VVSLLNTGSTSFSVSGKTVNAGTGISLIWQGGSWGVNGDGVGTGTFAAPYRYIAPSSLGLLSNALQNNSGFNNIGIGNNALQNNTTSNDNVAIGYNALPNSQGANVAIGAWALNGSSNGFNNVAIGESSLNSNNTNYNVAVGDGALSANTTGQGNVALGSSVLRLVTTTANNTVAGYSSASGTGINSDNAALGYYNGAVGAAAYTAAGSKALNYNLSNGAECTAIGYNAGTTDDSINATSNIVNATAIGAYACLTTSNTIILGSARAAYYSNVGIGTTTPGYKLEVNGSVNGVGAYMNTSDGRLKKDIVPVQNVIAKLKQLRPVTFTWKQDAAAQAGLNVDTTTHYGFIAQEIEQVLPQVVVTGKDKLNIKTVAYTDIIPVLTEAMKQQQQLIQTLRRKNEVLIRKLHLLQKETDQLEKTLTTVNPSRDKSE
jgi:hypothetical protein